MDLRLSRLAMGLMVVAAVVLLPDRCWAVFYPLGPSNDDWGMKYDVQLTAADGDKLNVVFTLADEGRLKPLYSATVIVFSEPDEYGGRTYLVKEPIKFKTTQDGKRAGQVQFPEKYLDRAIIRILTLTVDGRPQRGGARYYDLQLKNFANKTPLAASPDAAPSVATPPEVKVTR